MFLAALMLLIVGLGVAVNASEKKEGPQDPVLQAEIRSSVMNFADYLVTTLNQAALDFHKEILSPKTRLTGAMLRSSTISSAIDIASQPYAGVSLLNMIVFVTLNRMVWEKYWNPIQFNSQASEFVRVFKKLEKEIWDIAARILTAQQQSEMRELIDEWHKKNPEFHLVNYIRFRDFGSIIHKPSLHAATKPGGLLGPVKEAVQAVDEIRNTAERAIYLLGRMQLIAGLQINWIYEELVQQPEVRQVLSKLSQVSETSQALIKILESLPGEIDTKSKTITDRVMAQVTAEREDAVNHLMDRIADERKGIISAMDAGEEDLHKLLTEIDGVLSEGKALNIQVARTMGLFKGLMVQLDKTTLFKDSGSLDVDALHRLAVETAGAVEKVNRLIVLLNRLISSPDWKQRIPELSKLMDRTEAVGRSWITHVFLLAVALIIIFFLALTLYRYVRAGQKI